jgi:hypothetical protein
MFAIERAIYNDDFKKFRDPSERISQAIKGLKLNKFNELTLSDLNISSFQIKELTDALASNINILTLNISAKEIKDDTVLAIAKALEKNSSLISFKMDCSKSSNASLESLRLALEKNITLTKVNLYLSENHSIELAKKEYLCRNNSINSKVKVAFKEVNKYFAPKKESEKQQINNNLTDFVSGIKEQNIIFKYINTLLEHKDQLMDLIKHVNHFEGSNIKYKSFIQNIEQYAIDNYLTKRMVCKQLGEESYLNQIPQELYNEILKYCIYDMTEDNHIISNKLYSDIVENTKQESLFESLIGKINDFFHLSHD